MRSESRGSCAMSRMRSRSCEPRRFGGWSGGGDPVWLPGIKYLFVSMIEPCVDAAQHICDGPLDLPLDPLTLSWRWASATFWFTSTSMWMTTS